MTRSFPLRTALAGLVAAMAVPRFAAAAEAPSAAPPPASAPADVAVDVALHEEPPPRRIFSVEWNPLSLIINKLSVQLVVVPVDHHALVLNPFYTWTSTSPIDIYNDQSLQNNNAPAAQLPTQKFEGFGGEIGYRYYSGLGGPRGLFVGPSLILAGMTANAQNGSQTSYFDFGVAADVGYELIVLDSLSLAVGAGVQYATPSKTIPNQQFPADVYANSKVMPRALASIGWAF